MRHERERIVGFDRKIRVEWLDAAAMWAAKGIPANEIRARLARLVDGSVRGEKAKANTVSVLAHVWLRLPDELRPLRDDALRMLQDQQNGRWLDLHWGMCVATYPFFGDVAAATGRLTGVQGTASLSQITRRVTQQWGERSTVIRAVQRVVRSFVLWSVLEEADERGLFMPAAKTPVQDTDPVGPWLVEATLTRSGGAPRSLAGLVNDPTLFPFALHVSPRLLNARSSLEMHRQGKDEAMVMRTGGGRRPEQTR